MILLLLAGLTVVTAIAHASPPDPLWIAGVYDGADSDDAMALVTSGEATGSPSVATLPFHLPVTGSPAVAFTCHLPFAAFRSSQDRAPPSA